MIIYHQHDNIGAFTGGHTWYWVFRPIHHGLNTASSGAFVVGIQHSPMLMRTVGKLIN